MDTDAVLTPDPAATFPVPPAVPISLEDEDDLRLAVAVGYGPTIGEVACLSCETCGDAEAIEFFEMNGYHMSENGRHNGSLRKGEWYAADGEICLSVPGEYEVNDLVLEDDLELIVTFDEGAFLPLKLVAARFDRWYITATHDHDLEICVTFDPQALDALLPIERITVERRGTSEDTPVATADDPGETHAAFWQMMEELDVAVVPPAATSQTFPGGETCIA